MLKEYLSKIADKLNRGDAREESYYGILSDFLVKYSNENRHKVIHITTLPKQTEAGNPDFRIWDGRNKVTGYIEAKDPLNNNLDKIAESEQLKRYRETFPNVLLTNFVEFTLFRNGESIDYVKIADSKDLSKLGKKISPVNEDELYDLLDKYFSFNLPAIKRAKPLAVELAKRTRFLRDEVVSIEMKEEEKSESERKPLYGFYQAFEKHLIPNLSQEEFADLYSQTLTYGLFTARMRASEDFNREIAFKYIPRSIGILHSVFKYISLEDPPDSLKIIIDDISELLQVTNVKNILEEFYVDGKGDDPILHFYETFLFEFNPSQREKRGVYYTPESVVKYIVNSVHSLLISKFNITDGLAGKDVTLLDPAAGTLTFPVEAVKKAFKVYTEKYGEGGKKSLKELILKNFHAFEIMMAPYTIGHMKMSFLFEELDLKLDDNERFQLYLTNALNDEEVEKTQVPGLAALSTESKMALNVKKEKDILVIMGNPPYSGHSANVNDFISGLLKQDSTDKSDGYYTIEGQSLGEKNPKWLQDDYVKFIRFAQWKIQKSGKGIVGMITNHSYLDNPTFRAMRYSLMKSFNDIYIIDLHGNSLKKETTPEGGKDENVFDIRQGVAIAVFVKYNNDKECNVHYTDLFGLRDEKYKFLTETDFAEGNYEKIKPTAPYYFLRKRNTSNILHYLEWESVKDIFPINGAGMTTARDNFVFDDNPNVLKNRIRMFKESDLDDKGLHERFDINVKKGWDIRKAWKEINKIDYEDFDNYIKKVDYRPFQEKYIFYHGSIVWRTVEKVMNHMIKGENLGLITVRRCPPEKIPAYFLITPNIISNGLIRSDSVSIDTLFPIYTYPDENDGSANFYTEKEPNISKKIYNKLEKLYGEKPSPEMILYYIYGIFYSNTYREKYAEFLKIDFPRVPFTEDYEVFKKMSEVGERIAKLHLLDSKELDPPVAKYQGSGDNNYLEKAKYDKEKERIYINNDMYFEGVKEEVWDYYIGGYQVLQKYLKDKKGKTMDDPRHFCQVITAIEKTIELQELADEVYEGVE